MRPRAVLTACIAAVLGVALLAIPTTRTALSSLGAHSRAAAAGGWFSSPSPAARLAHFATQAAPPAPILRAPADSGSVKPVGNPSFFGWAFLDRKTGTITGSASSATGTNTTESMVKAWITSDYLRTQAAAGKTPSDAVLNELTLMIIDSNDDMAEKYYRMGGANAVLQRMVSMCGLTHTTLKPFYWALTQMSPQDAVKYGLCVANGTAAGPQWTQWVLDTMKKVRGGVNDQISVQKQGGRWGIIDGLPAELTQDLSIKNGWTGGYGDGWHINCLAIERDWVLNVMVRIGSLQGGANVCKAVAQQLVYRPDI
jgi:hypothetical protein